MKQIKFIGFLPFLVSFLLQFWAVDCCSMKSAFENASKNIASSVDGLGHRVENSANVLSNSLTTSTQTLANAATQSVADLTRAAVQVTDRLAYSLDNGVGKITNSFDKGLGRVANSVDQGIGRIADSFDNGVDKAQETIRELSQIVTNLTDNIQISIDSKDLAHAGKDAAESLQKAVSDLADKWKVAIRTEDLKSVGADAMGHLSKALQNLKAEIHFHFSIDVNLMSALQYLFIAIGVGFSVCCVAMIISLKSCRSCILASLESTKSLTCNCCTKSGKSKETNVNDLSKNDNVRYIDVRAPYQLPTAEVRSEMKLNDKVQYQYRNTLPTLPEFKGGISNLNSVWSKGDDQK